jgi:hypothetical protein
LELPQQAFSVIIRASPLVDEAEDFTLLEAF